MLDRDKIWYTAWACVPIAVALNVFVFGDQERGMRTLIQAQIESNAGNWVRALPKYEEAARKDPGSAVAAFNAAVASSKLGGWERAAAWTLITLERSPDFERGRMALEELERERPDVLAAAREQLAQASDREPGEALDPLR